jgi:hypothetical protein
VEYHIGFRLQHLVEVPGLYGRGQHHNRHAGIPLTQLADQLSRPRRVGQGRPPPRLSACRASVGLGRASLPEPPPRGRVRA